MVDVQRDKLTAIVSQTKLTAVVGMLEN